jgi:predicted transcriptional regulator
MKIVGLVFSFLVSSTILSSFYTSVHAHNFSQNQDSIFFTLVKRFEVEDTIASNNHDNKSNSLQHSENAANILKQIFLFNNSMANNANFVTTYKPIFDGLNVTTKALVAANLADESLKQYGLAQGLNVTQASSLLNITMNMGSEMKMGDNVNIPSGSTNQTLNLANEHDVDQANFETSTMSAESLKILFFRSLKNATLEKSTGMMQIPIEMKTESVKNLGQGLDNLMSALNREAPLQEVFSIVHGQIHPNLFLAYDLKLKNE